MIKSYGLTHNDALRTYTEHVVQQLTTAIETNFIPNVGQEEAIKSNFRMIVTGGGALNDFLIATLSQKLQTKGVTVMLPEMNVINYKEALVMALIGVLRWRQEYNVLSSVTGAIRDSIGGAVWIGQEA